MIRTLLAALIGWVIGAGLTVLLLRLTQEWLRTLTAPRVFEIEHGVIYVGMILGAGNGALVGAVVGMAGVLARSQRSSGR